LPVYSRADISRTMAIVVAPLLTADATRTLARQFRAAEPQSEDDPAVEALRHTGRLVAPRSGGRHQILVFHSRQPGEAAGVAIVTDFDRKAFEATMAGISAEVGRDPAVAEPIERIRKVE
jgi:TRAP-type C4-dicarboxylate transport system substrate-binding protein